MKYKKCYILVQRVIVFLVSQINVGPAVARSNVIPNQLGKSAKAEDAGPNAAWHVRYRTETIFLIRVVISAIGISASLHLWIPSSSSEFLRLSKSDVGVPHTKCITLPCVEDLKWF